MNKEQAPWNEDGKEILSMYSLHEEQGDWAAPSVFLSEVKFLSDTPTE